MGFKTEAFLLDAVNADFKLEEIELDDPLPNEVLVEIKACGLCHTDRKRDFVSDRTILKYLFWQY